MVNFLGKIVKNDLTILPDPATQQVWDLLNNVMDPEVPVLSVTDLGIVRNVIVTPGSVEITITPTYSGCPAIDMISMNIRIEMLAQGFKDVTIKHVLYPVWTTDWMSEAGKNKLRAYGIAPPNSSQQVCNTDLFKNDEAIQCPRCNSYHTHRISEFGSTACKSLHQCNDCHEPFDYFKCH